MFKQEDISPETMLEAGAHFGHQMRRWNPKMDRYRHATKNGVYVFDLFKTREALVGALNAIEDAVSKKKSILLVGTKKQVKDKVKEVAEKGGVPYVNERWLGGTFSNFKQIRTAVDQLIDMKKKMEAGEYNHLTKKERVDLQRDIDKMERKFGGLRDMKKIPDMMIVIDTHRERSAVKDAQREKVQLVGLVDSNGNPDLVDYPIPMNDDAPEAVSYVLDLIGKALEAKAAAPAVKKSTTKTKKATKKNE
jgi:small subunit ribosomal protein S2